jgi:hypothetical protein
MNVMEATEIVDGTTPVFTAQDNNFDVHGTIMMFPGKNAA